jgi:hypothetical protein
MDTSDDDDFLKNFDNSYIPPLDEKAQKKKDAEDKKKYDLEQKMHARMMSQSKKMIEKPAHIPLSEKELIEQKMMISKIKQYKLLFPNETVEFFKSPLSKKKGLEDLRAALLELDIIVTLGNTKYDSFLADIVANSTKSIELPLKIYMKLDITNLSETLKKNDEFNNIMKRIYLKYNCVMTYSSLPVECQLVLVIFLTGYLQSKINADIKREEQERLCKERENLLNIKKE